MHRFSARKTIDLVKTAVDGMFELKDELYPLPEGQEEDFSRNNNNVEISITPTTIQ